MAEKEKAIYYDVAQKYLQLRLQYAGCAQLLCACSAYLRPDVPEDLLENIEVAVNDWNKVTGNQYIVKRNAEHIFLMSKK